MDSWLLYWLGKQRSDGVGDRVCVYHVYVYLCIIVSLVKVVLSMSMSVYLCVAVSLGRQCEHACLLVCCCEPWKALLSMYIFMCGWEPLPGIK